MELKKSGAALLLFLVIVLTICGCDSGLEYVKLEVMSYPDKTIYVKDVDTSVSVNGLVLKLSTRDGHEEILKEPKGFTTNVDFSKEGTYYVTFIITEGVETSFPIQVVPIDG
jgi:hypothetical protein